MLTLFKPGPSGAKLEEYLATAAITAGSPVILAAAASATGQGKVTALTGAVDGSEYTYGVAVSSIDAAGVAAGDKVLVIPHEDGQVWLADSAANCDNQNIGALTAFLAATTYAVTIGSPSNQGNRVVIIGFEGAVGDKKYLVKFRKQTCLLG